MMTIKEFEEFRDNHTLAEFHKWFDQRTWYEIIIDDIPFPCIKISSKKVGLRNGSIFVIDNQVLRRLEMDERNLLLERRAFLDVYENLQKEEKFKANTYISLLHSIKVLEDDAWTNRNLDPLRLLRNGDKTVRCAFCNKLQDQAKKVIAGPRGVFICDECVDICNEILESEREK